MCACGSPNINGNLGYRWQPNDKPGVYPVDPPVLLDGSDMLLRDEPGRCGGMDCHSHHFRFVKRSGAFHLFVTHGRGQEVIPLYALPKPVAALLTTTDSDTAYWLMYSLFYARSQGEKAGADEVRATWQRAAVEKRIKTRKCRSYTKVWIEPQIVQAAATI